MKKKLGLNTKGPRKFVLIGVALLLFWVLFFDSHSVLKRVLLTVEARDYEVQNEVLRAEIEQLKVDIERAENSEAVERVAREVYGMRRSGETVYRVDESTE